MAIKIAKKIVGYNVVKEEEEQAPVAAPVAEKAEDNIVHLTDPAHRTRAVRDD